ncbi:MAG: CRTAC1 family protein [Planctomycetota bacterium]|nr:CRTAC1 family protein [Planctomycetota bacterium]
MEKISGKRDRLPERRAEDRLGFSLPVDPTTDLTLLKKLALLPVLGTFLAVFCQCSGDSLPLSTATFPELPGGIPVPRPESPVEDLAMCEGYSVELEDQLFRVAREIEKGHFQSIGAILSGDFEGESPFGLSSKSEKSLPFGTKEVLFQESSSSKVNALGFLEGFQKSFGAWQDLQVARWEVLTADFQAGRPPWGFVELEFFVRGRDAQGHIRSVTILFETQVVKDLGKWILRVAAIKNLKSQVREKPLFTEVSDSAGVAYIGPSFVGPHLWNGVACADVNGDGMWDLYVPTRERNFLYLARSDGKFDESAAEWGLLHPGDGTGAVFFDYDNDGDQDLAVGGEGFVKSDGELKGNPLRFYRNEGNRFVECGKELGLNLLSNTYSMMVLDYDMDGFLDLFLCNYGRFNEESNNSWNMASNAKPNALFRNIDGTGFEDVAQIAGVDDTRWSFASAAADWDHDGDQDIYLANDFGRNALLENLGNGKFKDISIEGTTRDLGFGMSASWCDMNNDGLLDLYVANMGIPVARRILKRLNCDISGMDGMVKMARGNSLLIQKNGGFEHAPDSLGGVDGGWAWGCAPNDFDLDGRLDLFCTNGYITRKGVGDSNSYYWQHVISSSAEVDIEPTIRLKQIANNKAFTSGLHQLGVEGRSFSGYERDKFWLNQGMDGFLDLSDISGTDAVGDGRAVIAADFDDDGDLDLFLNEMQLNRFHLLRNDIQETPTGFLKVQLQATTGQYQAVGAEVVVQTPEGPCSQVLALGSGYMSCNPPELIFGLGESESAQVEVLWPGGHRESFGEIKADSRVLLLERSGAPSPIESHKRSM